MREACAKWKRMPYKINLNVKSYSMEPLAYRNIHVVECVSQKFQSMQRFTFTSSSQHNPAKQQWHCNPHTRSILSITPWNHMKLMQLRCQNQARFGQDIFNQSLRWYMKNLQERNVVIIGKPKFLEALCTSPYYNTNLM